MDETLTEHKEAPDAGRVTLLTRVLSYDDLTAPNATTLRLDDLPLSIGRGPGDVLSKRRGSLGVPDRWMSSAQARLERRDGRILLIDAGSRNGSYVNGERVAEHVLADGDLVELGHTLFCFRTVTQLAAEAAESAPEIGAIRTRSPAMALVLRDLARIAPSRESVLVLAETGAGKESLAATVHALSGRAGPLRAVDCGAIPETLFESTLFGHRRGAFTSAVEARTGEIARADGGTLFLDEVGNLPRGAQAKLLRVIEEGVVVPVGAADGQKVNVRWVAATNRELFGDDAFRPDLLQRLGGWVARVPPLRERREDLGELSAALLREAKIARCEISVDAARALFGSDFPGNIRELGATLRSAALLADGACIEVSHLPQLQAVRPASSPSSGSENDLPAIEAALSKTHGNVVRAARELHTHPRQVYRWIEKHNISLDRFRSG